MLSQMSTIANVVNLAYNGQNSMAWFPIPKWYSDFGDPVIKGYLLSVGTLLSKIGSKIFLK